MAISEQEKRTLALTIAGEIHPGLSRYGTDANRQEIANILSTIGNRAALNGTSYSDEALSPKQYSTWNNAKNRATAEENYRLHKDAIDQAVADYFSGDLRPSHSGLTNYYSPSGMRPRGSIPKWDWSSMEFVTETGPHRFYANENVLIQNDPATVAALQTALAAAGYDPGPIDGVMGPQTRAAFEAYQANGSGVEGDFSHPPLTSYGDLNNEWADFRTQQVGLGGVAPAPNDYTQLAGLGGVAPMALEAPPSTSISGGTPIVQEGGFRAPPVSAAPRGAPAAPLEAPPVMVGQGNAPSILDAMSAVPDFARAGASFLPSDQVVDAVNAQLFGQSISTMSIAASLMGFGEYFTPTALATDYANIVKGRGGTPEEISKAFWDTYDRFGGTEKGRMEASASLKEIKSTPRPPENDFRAPPSGAPVGAVDASPLAPPGGYERSLGIGSDAVITGRGSGYDPLSSVTTPRAASRPSYDPLSSISVPPQSGPARYDPLSSVQAPTATPRSYDPLSSVRAPQVDTARLAAAVSGQPAPSRPSGIGSDAVAARGAAMDFTPSSARQVRTVSAPAPTINTDRTMMMGQGVPMQEITSAGVRRPDMLHDIGGGTMAYGPPPVAANMTGTAAHAGKLADDAVPAAKSFTVGSGSSLYGGLPSSDLVFSSPSARSLTAPAPSASVKAKPVQTYTIKTVKEEIPNPAYVPSGMTGTENHPGKLADDYVGPAKAAPAQPQTITVERTIKVPNPPSPAVPSPSMTAPRQSVASQQAAAARQAAQARSSAIKSFWSGVDMSNPAAVARASAQAAQMFGGAGAMAMGPMPAGVPVAAPTAFAPPPGYGPSAYYGGGGGPTGYYGVSRAPYNSSGALTAGGQHVPGTSYSGGQVRDVYGHAMGTSSYGAGPRGY